jgi:GT2 family glycosyltransferase/glycosyltransferase involved in cell wall biosynthesis
MNRFWNIVMRPIIEEIKAEYIVEVGSDTGVNTKNILDYCMDNNAHMTAVDPFPKFDVDEFKSNYGDKFEIYTDLSLSVLPLLEDYDVILLDGDHNWYTVFNELKTIEKSFKNKKFPLIFLHDIGWPYSRRDLYYNPENIPEIYRQPYKQLGMYPGQRELKEKGGLNPHIFNAITENTPKNGVLTALEDFVDQSNLELSFEFLPVYHGLGILYPKNKELENKIKEIINNANLLYLLEMDRTKLFIEKKSTQQELNKNRSQSRKSEAEMAKTQKKLDNTQIKLKKINTQLDQTKSKLDQTEIELKLSNILVNQNKAQLVEFKRKEEKQLKELTIQINNVTNNFYEINYLNRNGMSIAQRIILKFPSFNIIRNSNGIKNTIKNIKGYHLIKKNHLLDIGYYLKNNNDVRISGKDPILHYLNHGFKEGRKPSSKFDGNYYLKKYPDVKTSDLNPLIHYSLYGIKEGRKTIEVVVSDKSLAKPNFIRYNTSQIDNILNALDNNKISIILPLYNAFEDVERCIKSVLENTKIPYELILVDDQSSDERIKTLLDEIEKIPDIKVIRNPERLGFVKSINAGIQNSKGDVVLLKSDTIVTSKWLQKLLVKAYSDHNIGTVTPLSNRLGLFSVPEKDENNESQEYLNLEEKASMVEKISENINIKVTNCNDFCMLIKRETIEDVGLFDTETIEAGHSKENDFCMRANEKSWKNLLDDSIYIYHKIDELLLKEKKESLEENKAEGMVSSKEYENIQNKISNKLIKSSKSKKRILYVLHSAGGGTPATNEDLMRNIQKDLDCYVLTSSGKEMNLWRYNNNEFEEIDKIKIKSKWSAKNFHNTEFRNIYFNVLNVLKIDIVHIRHLIKHSFDLPYIAKSLGLPTIISFHDFYFICPSHNLLDDKHVYCAGKCTEGKSQCLIGVELNDLPILKDYIPVWRNAVADMLSKSSALVTTSKIVKQLYISIYPELAQKDFRVIEHGRDFEEIDDSSKFYEVPSQDKPIKILFPGNINIVKGSELMKNIKNLDHENRLEFHFVGALASQSSDLINYGIHHGPYERNDFCKMVASIKPTFIGILSMWPETYCHTLSEAWSCGVPVLTSKIGVLEERVNNNGGGWLIDHENPQKAYNEIIRIANSPDEYIKVVNQVNNITFKSTKEMAEEYRDLYFQKLYDEPTVPDHEHLNKSLKGKNGYLFLVNDSNNEIKQHFDQFYEHKFNPKNFIRNLKMKKDYCLRNNIKYFFFITPDKSLVCKDQLPFKTKLTKRNYDSINDLVPDFTDNLDDSCYFKADSHMNYVGGMELSYSYLNHIDNKFTRDDFELLIADQINTEESVINLHFGDLLAVKNWSYPVEEKDNYRNEKAVLFKNQFLVDNKEKLPEEFKIVGVRETEYYLNPHGFSDLKVLILRDSTTNYLKDILSVYFKEILFYWDHWKFNKELVEWYKPDIIIEIRTERFLEINQRLEKY